MENKKQYAVDFREGHDDFKAGKAAASNQSEAYNQGYIRCSYNKNSASGVSINSFGTVWSR